ncbi:MAG: methyltransferase family protein [Terracidiphilus sp.]
MMSPKLAFSGLAIVLFQLGLAVLGWGGFSAFFSHPALVALTIASLALFAVSLFSSGNVSTGEQEDRGNRWVIVAFSFIMILLAYLPAYTDRIGFWTLDGDTTRWIGVVLLVGGSALRLWPVFVLGNRFSGLVAIQHGHVLVTTGVYGMIRNPSYLGLLTSSLGWSLAFHAGAGVVLVACFIPPLVARIHAEERLLRSHFGSEYDAYCARTSRLVPGIY